MAFVAYDLWAWGDILRVQCMFAVEYTHPQIEGCSFAVVVICSYDISGFVPNRNREICMIEKQTKERDGRGRAKGTWVFVDTFETFSHLHLAHMKEHKILYRSH